jgi:hypothetical protein
MEAILLIIGVFVGGVLLFGLPTMIRRKMIIKKYFIKMGEEVLSGSRDYELLEHSKRENYTSHGLAAPFNNEASRNALSEIQANGLAHNEEKDRIWIRGEHSLKIVVDQEKILTEHISKRCKIIGARILD